MTDNGTSSKSSDRQRGRTAVFLKGTFVGLLFGVLIGWALGWWFRPPSSFPIEELKQATEEKFTTATDSARQQLAEFAEDLAKKLRDSKKEEK